MVVAILSFGPADAVLILKLMKQTNCPARIGSLRDICLPVQEAFMLWATNINGCEDTTESTMDNTTCWEGLECRATTRLCVWHDAEHTWGSTMPGVDMVSEFLENLQLSDANSDDKQVVVDVTSSGSYLRVPSLVIFLTGVVALVAWIFVGKDRARTNGNLTELQEVVELVDSKRLNPKRVAVTRFV